MGLSRLRSTSDRVLAISFGHHRRVGFFVLCASPIRKDSANREVASTFAGWAHRPSSAGVICIDQPLIERFFGNASLIIIPPKHVNKVSPLVIGELRIIATLQSRSRLSGAHGGHGGVSVFFKQRCPRIELFGIAIHFPIQRNQSLQGIPHLSGIGVIKILIAGHNTLGFQVSGFGGPGQQYGERNYA